MNNPWLVVSGVVFVLVVVVLLIAASLGNPFSSLLLSSYATGLLWIILTAVAALALLALPIVALLVLVKLYRELDRKSKE
jgi:uncharacterized membrane protein